MSLARPRKRVNAAVGTQPRATTNNSQAAVGVWAFPGDSAEYCEDEQRGDRSDEEDGGAGGEELAGVWLHKGSE